MAQIALPYTPAYREDELRFDLLKQSFCERAHSYYTVYDEVMDQIIVRLVEPSVFASEYFVDPDTAFLVRDDDREVVGFTILNFQTEFIKRVPRLNELWEKHNLARSFRTFRTFKYEPKQQKKKQMPEQRIVAYSAYQSMAASELVAA